MITYKKCITGLLFSASLLATTAANANVQSYATGCAAKKQNIENQIGYAKAHGNQRRVNGLETALREVERNCTTASLQRERADKLQQKERKVAERTRELTLARETGDEDKIMKKMKKLAEAKTELAEARASLLK